MSVAASKQEFERAAKGLPRLATVDFSEEVICIEPITGAYFRDEVKQRCIVRKNGRLYVADYD